MSAHAETGCPEVVLASIAWYPDQLDEDRRGLVEAHAAECRACREELLFVQGESAPEIPAADAERIYGRVQARMEHGATRPIGVAPEGVASEVASGAPPPPQAQAREARRRTLGVRPAALAAGLAVALLGGVVGAVGVQLLGAGADPAYQVAGGTSQGTSQGVPGEAGAAALDVVFRPEARAEAVQQGLLAVGGRIVSGPTPLGVYRVALAPGADVAAAARTLRGDGRGIASFAEPAHGTPH